MAPAPDGLELILASAAFVSASSFCAYERAFDRSEDVATASSRLRDVSRRSLFSSARRSST
jgi:hypothetical protein